MASFAHLPPDDRWALAFYVGTLASSAADAERGMQLWQSDPVLRQKTPNLQTLTQVRQVELAQGMGDDKAHALTAWLRRHPEAITSGSGLVSRGTPVQTAMRNCPRDEGRSFEVGNQVLISSHRRLLSSKARVVNAAEKLEQDFDRYD